MVAERWDEQVGSVADEAARLLESLRRSAADAQAAAGTSAGTDGGAGHGPYGCGRPDGRHGIRVEPRTTTAHLPASAPVRRVAPRTTRSARGARCAAGRRSSARSAPRP